MESLKRLFHYVYPQWPRVIVVVISALVVAILLSVSFMSLIPMLKVMLGKEGLHGWIDRKTCHWKYGVDFYVPEATDFTREGRDNLANYLLVTDVREKSLAEAAGLQETDRIFGVATFELG